MMIKHILSFATLSVSLCIASQSHSEELKPSRLVPHTALHQDGLYEVVSPNTGNVIYIYAVNGQPTQIYAVPSGLTTKKSQDGSKQ